MLTKTGGDTSRTCVFGKKSIILGEFWIHVHCVSPKENYSLKQTHKSKYMKQLQDSIEFLKLIFTWMPNSEEKAKSLQSRFCNQAHITRLQFAQWNGDKNHLHHQQPLWKMKKWKKDVGMSSYSSQHGWMWCETESISFIKHPHDYLLLPITRGHTTWKPHRKYL